MDPPNILETLAAHDKVHTMAEVKEWKITVNFHMYYRCEQACALCQSRGSLRMGKANINTARSTKTVES